MRFHSLTSSLELHSTIEILHQVFSGLSEEKVWTTLKNNIAPQTSVTRAEKNAKAVLQITYNVSDEQVHKDTRAAAL